MKRLLIASMLASIGLGAAIVEPPLREISFVVDRARVRLGAQLTAAHLTPDGEAVLVARGILFEPARFVELRSAWRQDQSTPLAAVENYHKALLSGTDDQILGFWYPDERAEIRKMLANPEYRRRNRHFLESLGKMRMYGILEFPGNPVAFISHGKVALGVNTVNKNGRWYVTNKAPNDLAVAIAEAAFADGIVKYKSR